MKNMIIVVIGVILWLSMYLFMETKIEKLNGLKKKPIIRSLVLFVYMYIGVSFIMAFLQA